MTPRVSDPRSTAGAQRAGTDAAPARMRDRKTPNTAPMKKPAPRRLQVVAHSTSEFRSDIFSSDGRAAPTLRCCRCWRVCCRLPSRRVCPLLSAVIVCWTKPNHRDFTCQQLCEKIFFAHRRCRNETRAFVSLRMRVWHMRRARVQPRAALHASVGAAFIRWMQFFRCTMRMIASLRPQRATTASTCERELRSRRAISRCTSNFARTLRELRTLRAPRFNFGCTKTKTRDAAVAGSSATMERRFSARLLQAVLRTHRDQANR